MHLSCMIFGAIHLSRDEIRDKTVIDVGSYDYNGNYYALLRHFGPKKFVGVDMFPGPGVDVVCKGEDILNRFGPNSFDVVVSTELLEHVRNWRTVLSNIKNVCKPGGLVVITTRSFGFPLHGYPYDYWRYEVEDMKRIFSDFEILALEKDTEATGIFIKVRKPLKFVENDLSTIALYSMIENKRIRNIDVELEKRFITKYQRRKKLVSVRDLFSKKIGGFLQEMTFKIFNL